MVPFTVSVGLVHLRGRAADIYLTRPHCASGNMYHYSPHFGEFYEHTFLLLIVNNNIVILLIIFITEILAYCLISLRIELLSQGREQKTPAGTL